jgi:hypothetical protein
MASLLPTEADEALLRQRRRAGRRARLERLQSWLAHYLLSHPCADCGEPDIRVLEFDHMGGKTDTVSRMVRALRPLTAVAAEVAKCTVRCACCHRIRHAEADGSWRARYAPGAPEAVEAITIEHETFGG